MTGTDWLALLDIDRRGLAVGGPASESDLATSEDRLGRPLPMDLRSLLLAANGFEDLAGQWQCAWDSARIAVENRDMWRAGSLPDSRLAFGDNGAGDPFCIVLGGSDQGRVEEWSPIDLAATRSWPSLEAFWRDWLAT